MEDLTNLCFPTQTLYLHKVQTKTLTSNQIAGFFDNQYILKGCIAAFGFLHEDNFEEKVVSETTVFVGYVQLSSLGQYYLELLGVSLVNLRVRSN